MKKTVIFLAVIMAMFMLPTVCSAVGIDGTISMDTELIEFDDDLSGYDSEEWYYGDSEMSYEEYLNSVVEQELSSIVTKPIEDSTLNLDDPNETSDININLPSSSGMVNILGDNTIARQRLGITSTNHTYSLQGGCTDGENIYFAFYVKDKTSDATVGQRIVCGKLKDDGSFDFENAIIRSFKTFGHVNTLTYNKRTDEIIMTLCYSKKEASSSTETSYLHNQVIAFDAKYLRGEEEIKTYTRHYIGCRTNALVYDEYQDKYIVGISGRKYNFAILNKDFQLERVMGLDRDTNEPYDNWSSQSIWCDHSNIYSLCIYAIKDSSGKTIDYKNSIIVFDKDTGEMISEMNINIIDDGYVYEAENFFRIDDRFILSFNAIGSKSFRYYDIAPSSAFKIEYFDNMDVEDDDVKTFDDSQLKQDDTNLVIYGVSAELKQNSFCKEGWRFKGWALYRPDIDSWFCADESGNKAWSPEVPDNGSKVIYEDKQRVMAICPKGKKIILVAQWKQANYFYVTYYFDYDKQESITKNYVHANTVTLLDEPFANSRGSKFLGWYAHWVENDEWYCSTSSGVKGWYKENEIPSGYTKHLFGNEASIYQLTGSGQNIEMFGVWNEYTIFYHPGVKITYFKQILSSQKGARGISSYNTVNALSSYGTNSTWYHCWLDGDQWYYASADGATRGWYSDDAIPSGYSRYINDRGYTKSSVAAGDSLILCWAISNNASFDF